MSLNVWEMYELSYEQHVVSEPHFVSAQLVVIEFRITRHQGTARPANLTSLAQHHVVSEPYIVSELHVGGCSAPYVVCEPYVSDVHVINKPQVRQRRTRYCRYLSSKKLADKIKKNTCPL